MQPLTSQVWAKHFVELRPFVLERFPTVDRPALEGLRDDYDGVVELVQRATGMDADDTRHALRTLDVEPLGLGTGEQPRTADNEASLDELHLQKGFTEAERPRVVERMSQLNRHLRRFPADATFLELSAKDRDANTQVVTLECEVPGFNRFVAKSHETDIRAALADVRDDMIEQIDKAVDKRAPAKGGR